MTAMATVSPANSAGLSVARLEGFEPPTFWSVARLAVFEQLRACEVEVGESCASLA